MGVAPRRGSFLQLKQFPDKADNWGLSAGSIPWNWRDMSFHPERGPGRQSTVSRTVRCLQRLKDIEAGKLWSRLYWQRFISVLTTCFWLFSRFSLAHVIKDKLLSLASQPHNELFFLLISQPPKYQNYFSLTCVFSSACHVHPGRQPFPSHLVLPWLLTPALVPVPSVAHIHCPSALWGSISGRCVCLPLPVRC